MAPANRNRLPAKNKPDPERVTKPADAGGAPTGLALDTVGPADVSCMALVAAINLIRAVDPDRPPPVTDAGTACRAVPAEAVLS